MKNILLKMNYTLYNLPPDVFIIDRDGIKIAVNYSSNDFNLPITKEAKILLGESLLKPGEVTIWTEY